MAPLTQFQRHVLFVLTRFLSELSPEKLNQILQSVTSQKELNELVDSIERPLRAELVQQVKGTLSRLAAASNCDIELWGLLFASLDNSNMLPVTLRAQALARMLTFPLQDVALVAIGFSFFLFRVQIRPIELGGRIGLEARGCRYSSLKEAVAFLYSGQMYFNYCWTALCKQVIAEKMSSRHRRIYRRRTNSFGTSQQWSFEGSAEQWVQLRAHLFTVPPLDDTPAVRQRLLGEG